MNPVNFSYLHHPVAWSSWVRRRKKNTSSYPFQPSHQPSHFCSSLLNLPPLQALSGFPHWICSSSAGYSYVLWTVLVLHSVFSKSLCTTKDQMLGSSFPVSSGGGLAGGTASASSNTLGHLRGFKDSASSFYKGLHPVISWKTTKGGSLECGVWIKEENSLTTVNDNSQGKSALAK